MRKSILMAASVALLSVGGAGSASAYLFDYNFDAGWSGDYAPGWENSGYRHGTAPVGKMMEYTAGQNGTGGMKLLADSVASDSQFWVGVNPMNIDYSALVKEMNPWVSVSYFDEGPVVTGGPQAAGQVYTVPSWVNPYIDGSEDWTDIQLGARTSKTDNYYYVAAGESGPGWVNTGVGRTGGQWVELKMQLLNSDGRVHFFIDGTEVGASYRNDYKDLGTAGLYTMFTTPLSTWGDNKPYTVWDNYKVGSDAVPEPFTMTLGAAALGLAAIRKLRRK